MSIEQAVVQFGLKFKGRLNNDLLEFALEYVNFSEGQLAIETLCDYLCEYDIALSVEEFEEMNNILKEYDVTLSQNLLVYIENLVTK